MNRASADVPANVPFSVERNRRNSGPIADDERWSSGRSDSWACTHSWGPMSRSRWSSASFTALMPMTRQMYSSDAALPQHMLSSLAGGLRRIPVTRNVRVSGSRAASLRVDG